ncbi:hypothetical protein R69927_00806 [Paraburkholderia domus]|nr:hypothetical protein R69927_00806 [Paraburkholderia domus]
MSYDANGRLPLYPSDDVNRQVGDGRSNNRSRRGRGRGWGWPVPEEWAVGLKTQPTGGSGAGGSLSTRRSTGVVRAGLRRGSLFASFDCLLSSSAASSGCNPALVALNGV